MWTNRNESKYIKYMGMTRGRVRLSPTSTVFPYGTDSRRRVKSWTLTLSCLNIAVSGLQGMWLACNSSLFGWVSLNKTIPEEKTLVQFFVKESKLMKCLFSFLFLITVFFYLGLNLTLSGANEKKKTYIMFYIWEKWLQICFIHI